MKKIYIVFATIGLIIGWYFFNTKKHLPPNELIIGTSADYPPFQYLNNNQISGFEIELIHEIADRIGRPVIIKNLPFNTLFSEIQMGNIHIIASALTETPERSKNVLFTPVYMEKDQLLLVSRVDKPINNIESIIDTDKKVIVNKGYTSDLYTSKIDGLNVIKLKNINEGFLALNSKKADAFIVTQNIARPFLKKYQKENFSISKIKDLQDSYSLAISKEHPTLLAPIAAALENMKKDGSLIALKEKWHII